MRRRGIPGASFETRLAGIPQDDGVFSAIRKTVMVRRREAPSRTTQDIDAATS
jgi:hypothetical protein